MSESIIYNVHNQLISIIEKIKQYPDNDKSKNLIEAINLLESQFSELTISQWFAQWLRNYKYYFFFPYRNSASELIKKDFISLWTNLTIDEQFAFGKVSELLYNFPNINEFSFNKINTELFGTFNTDFINLVEYRGYTLDFETSNADMRISSFIRNEKDSEDILIVHCDITDGDLKFSIVNNSNLDVESVIKNIFVIYINLLSV